MKARLIKTENGYGLKDCELIAFVSTVRTEHRHHKLSLKNCQAIERRYDLDELAGEYANKELNVELTSKVGNFYGFSSSFKAGFQKALEILGDRRFTEEDLLKTWNKGAFYGSTELGNTHYFNGHIQSLQQNEWEVEILMEEVAIGDKYTPDPKPKLDADGCLILKRVT